MGDERLPNGHLPRCRAAHLTRIIKEKVQLIKISMSELEEILLRDIC